MGSVQPDREGENEDQQAETQGAHAHPAIASGSCDDLVSRSADVMLKEARKLVLCIRDTPFSRIHLENMLRAQTAGAVIMPAVPSFYHQPKSIDDLVTQYVCRVLAQIGLAQDRMYRWTGSHTEAKKAEA